MKSVVAARLVALFAIAFAACNSAELVTPPNGASSGGDPNQGSPNPPSTTDDGGAATTRTQEAGAEAVGTTGLALSVHTTLGIPEAASVNDPAHALLVKPQYVVSYDSVVHRNPNWTSWELTTAWLGSASRSNNFVADTQLPSTMTQASASDYSGSGFERGHLCPSADRTDTAADNVATFVFTNVVPQTAASNTGTWETLESYERSLAASNHLFIIAGPIYATTPAQTIGSGVAVPTSMFKVVVVMQGDHPTPADVTTSTRVISVEIPNTTTVSGDYTGYRTSFGALETKTGFRFMSDVPASIHDALAARIDGQ